MYSIRKQHNAAHLCLYSWFPFLFCVRYNQWRGEPYSKFSFGEVYRRIYGRKLNLRRRVSGAVKRDFRTYIRRYTSPNENFEYGYPHSNALLIFFLKNTVKLYFVAPIRPAAASCIYSLVSQWKAKLRNDVGFPTVYRRLYCRRFMTLSNQTSRYICKCIRMQCNMLVNNIRSTQSGG